MKNFLFLLLLVSASAMSQNVTQPKSEIAKILCHEWTIDYAMINEMKIPMTVKIIMKFNPDGTCTGTMAGESKAGVWTFDEVGKFIAVKMKSTLNITSMSETELTLVEIKPIDGQRETINNSTFHAVRL